MRPERSSQGAQTLPGEYYTSPRIYDRESGRIFGRRWLCIGLRAKLEEPGTYFLADVEGESIIVVRDREDRIHAFYNLCRHRGTRLCAESQGKLGRHIVCPYHSWAYDLSGRLVRAPNMTDVDGFDPAALPLYRVAVAIWEGLIFLNLDREPPPFETAFTAAMSKFQRWHMPELIPVHRVEYDVGANWKLLFQNYSECYHCPTLHPTLNRLTPYRDSSNDLDQGPILGGPMKLSSRANSMTMDGRACGVPLGDLAGDELRLVHYYVLFPSLFLSLMPDYALIHRLARRGAHRTRITCEWLFHPDAVAKPGFDPSGAIGFWDQTNRQDWEICERCQQGVASRAYRPGPYGNLESLLAAFDREYLAALGDLEDE